MRRAALALVVAASACNGILGNREGHPYEDAGADGGATCDAGCPPVELASSRDCPSDLAVANGRVYWVDQGSVQNSARDGMVASVPIGGCDACAITHASGEVSPSAIAVNVDAIYFATVALPANGAIRTVAFDGTPPRDFATGQRFPRAVALDATSAFWVNAGDGPPTANGEVRRAFLDGNTSAAIVPKLDSPVAIAIRDGVVYWTNDGDSDVSGYVMTSDVTGSGASRVASNQSHPHGIATGGTYVYWANMGDGTIMRAQPNGAGLTRLFTDRATPSDVAVDDLAIYWVEAGTPPDFADGKVMAARLDGSDVRTIAAAQRDPRAIAIDGSAVYWIARGTRGCAQHDGRVMQAHKPF